jgi:hypothetical protein
MVITNIELLLVHLSLIFLILPAWYICYIDRKIKTLIFHTVTISINATILLLILSGRL